MITTHNQSQGAGNIYPADQLRILIVEDNADCADSTTMILRLYGFRAEVASDGVSAVEIAEGIQPDVLILDIGLPGINGYQVAERLTTKQWQKRPFIIAVSGYADAESRRLSSAAGIDVHLAKPAEPAQLVAILQRLQAILPAAASG